MIKFINSALSVNSRCMNGIMVENIVGINTGGGL